MTSLVRTIAMVGILGVATSTAVRAATPAVLREFGVKTTDAPALVHEIVALEGLYRKHGLNVKIEAFQGTFSGDSSGEIAVQLLVPSLAELQRVDEATRTLPDLVAQIKKMEGMQEIVYKALYEKLTP